MINLIKEKLTSKKISTRIITLLSLFLIMFFIIVILSYFILPEGYLLNRNNLTNFDTSNNLVLCALQIFFIVGLLLMLMGAFIESNSIINL